MIEQGWNFRFRRRGVNWGRHVHGDSMATSAISLTNQSMSHFSRGHNYVIAWYQDKQDIHEHGKNFQKRDGFVPPLEASPVPDRPVIRNIGRYRSKGTNALGHDPPGTDSERHVQTGVQLNLGPLDVPIIE